MGKASSLGTLGLFLLALLFAASAPSQQLPPAVTQAHTAYLSNETGKASVLDAAIDQLGKWHHLTLVQDRESADLVLVFSHRSGLDKFGNAGFTVLEVFQGHGAKPVFHTQKAGKLIWVKELPTRSCVDDLMRHLEAAQDAQALPPSPAAAPPVQR